MVIDLVRTMKPPVTELMDRLLDVLPQEMEFVTRLTGFDEYSLEFARRRLEIESNKVLSRLELIGGDSVMKTSLLGIGGDSSFLRTHSDTSARTDSIGISIVRSPNGHRANPWRS